MNPVNRFRHALPQAFTLIELITVIAIIAILMGLLLPAVTVVRNTANKARAKSDVLNIVSAVKSYYTDYGQYPNASTGPYTADQLFGPTVSPLAPAKANWVLMDVLRNVTDSTWMLSGSSANARGVVYLDVPNAQGAVAKGGIVSGSSGVQANTGTPAIYGGDFVDPWGMAYFVGIDYDYSNTMGLSIWTDVGTNSLRTGVIAFSIGLDGQLGYKGNGKLNATSSSSAADDVVSFQ
jgi:prepilin-type N-terminal cleavage/methylation domain-containing protein